jgi:hypothetical protein
VDFRLDGYGVKAPPSKPQRNLLQQSMWVITKKRDRGEGGNKEREWLPWAQFTREGIWGVDWADIIPFFRLKDRWRSWSFWCCWRCWRRQSWSFSWASRLFHADLSLSNSSR